MPQPGNINDPIQRGTGYLPYTYTVPHGEGGAKQLLELDKLRFSLDDFQKLSSGKYNAGYLTLTSKGKLDIANSHKTLTFLNNTKLDSTDAFAIRKAFAEALQNAGVSEEKMDAIRKRLGLGDGLSFRNFTSVQPLTRQEVREIIDENLGEINAARVRNGKEALMSDIQLHADYSDAEIADIAEVRTAIGKSAVKKAAVKFEASFMDVMDILTLKDFSAKSRTTLIEMDEFLAEFRGAFESLTNEGENEAWRHENGDKLRIEPVTGNFSIAIDPKTKNVIAITESGGKRLTFSLGVNEDRLNELLEIAKRRIDKAIASKGTPFDELAEGSGKGTITALTKQFEAHTLATDPNADPVEEFQQKMDRSVKKELVANIAQQIGEKFRPDYDETAFKKDLYRDLDVSVNGAKLPNGDLAGARDKMVQFVSGDETMTWAKASQELKVKANIVMALCNQQTLTTPFTAFSDTLDTVPGNTFNTLSLTENTDKGKGHHYAFSVTKDAKGAIVIGVRGYQYVRALTTTDDKGKMDDQDLDASSHVDFEMTIKIPKANLDKLGKADWTKYNHAPVQKTLIDTLFSKEGRAKAASLVPAPYTFDGSVHVTVTAHLDEPGQPTKDLMQDNLPKAKPEPPAAEQPEA
ncbi:MAG: hypothetical protein J6U40_11680 [Kiritimatiellae bacterium]|nr:hypothetical protein [Kiritimatiellia bacterium]